jgi:hypothetical protein
MDDNLYTPGGSPSVTSASERFSFGSIVEPLEKREHSRIQNFRRVKCRHLLDDDMRVTLNETLVIQLLRRRIIILLCIYEVSRLEVLDFHLNGELLICWYCAAVLREYEFGRWHPIFGRNDTHRSRVARTPRNLFAIGQRQVHRFAEIDIVIG